MKGLSTQQLVVLGACFLALLGTIAAVLVEEWKVAVVAAATSFGLFTVLVAFTLSAMHRVMRGISGRLRTIDREMSQTRHIAAGVRRIDNRTTERFKMFEATEARLEAAERRLLATFEAHRLQLEDEIAELRKEQLSEK